MHRVGGELRARADGPNRLGDYMVKVSFVPAEDTYYKETLVNEWAKPNGVTLTVELVGQNDVQPKGHRQWSRTCFISGEFCSQRRMRARPITVTAHKLNSISYSSG